MRRRNLVLGSVAALLVIGAVAGGGAGDQQAPPEPSSTASAVVVTQAPTTAPTVTAVPTPGLTAGQRNAISKAESYLAFTAFSRSGLIEQLTFEDFASDDATFAVDSLDVDWQEQAYQKGLSYLDFTSFSLSGLIEQLEFEGFTTAQAEYGGTKAYNE